MSICSNLQGGSTTVIHFAFIWILIRLENLNKKIDSKNHEDACASPAGDQHDGNP